MKSTISFQLISLVLLSITSCKSGQRSANVTIVTNVAPGTVIDSFNEPVTEDKLNHFNYTVKIIADSAVDKGIYIAEAAYGPNVARGKFTMPKGMEQAKPILKKCAFGHCNIVGFRLDGDTTFYDYFEINSTKTETGMRYINSYSFE
jgi:hypothetical protein